MTPKERWLAATWPQVRDALPATPADVLEIGCGELGGFVPKLLEAGYAAVGVDPQAPAGREFRATRFEEYAAPAPVDAVVASTSLHHVDDLGDVLDRVAATLRPGGVVIVVEWAWERFDEPTARWCFERLTPPVDEDHESWLHRHQQRWTESDLPWEDYFRGWTAEEGLHPGGDIVRALDERFHRRACAYGAYFFPELDNTEEREELAAIATGAIQAAGITWVGRRRKS